MSDVSADVHAPRGPSARWLEGLAARTPVRVLACLSTAAAFSIVVILNIGHRVDWWFLDGGIYRSGGAAAGAKVPGSLYEHFDGVGAFTYPPFAALLFMPLSWLPSTSGAVMFQSASLIAVLITLGLLLCHYGMSRSGAGWIVGLVATPVLVFYPVFRSVGLGQIDGQLMALICIDVLVLSRRTLTGVLSGLAASIKVTPAVVLGLFMARRDWRSTARLVGTMALLTVVGHLVMPRDSHVFWTDYLFRTDRVGGQFVAANQSLAAVLSRAFQPDQMAISGWVRLLWIVLVLASAALWLVAVRRALAAGWLVEALFATVVLGLLISPVLGFITGSGPHPSSLRWGSGVLTTDCGGVPPWPSSGRSSSGSTRDGCSERQANPASRRAGVLGSSWSATPSSGGESRTWCGSSSRRGRAAPDRSARVSRAGHRPHR